MSKLLNPPEETEQPAPQPPRRGPRISVLALIGISGALVLLFTALLVIALPPTFSKQQAATQQPSPTQNPQNGPLSGMSSVEASQILPADKSIIYEKADKLFVVPATGGASVQLQLPGYSYNPTIPPILLPSGLLLYSGDGIWLTDLAGTNPQQIATLPQSEVITSMVVSADGTTLAWSAAPANGKGVGQVYAGPLNATQKIYDQQASDCPCFRAFSFLNMANRQPNSILLLTDDRGDHHLTRFGLWTLDLAANPIGAPMLFMDNTQQQGPLALIARNNTLLYSDNEGIVPSPTDQSVPDEVTALNYANSLYMTNIQTSHSQVSLGTPAEILPPQDIRSNISGVRWIATPTFSPDGHTLAYVLFSSDNQAPFGRHSALYTVQFNNTKQQAQVAKPQLLAAATSRFIELGPWINDHQLTYYADGRIYAVDTSMNKIAVITTSGAYARIVGVVAQITPK